MSRIRQFADRTLVAAACCALAALVGSAVSGMPVQSPAIPLEPAPDIRGVIQGGTRPQLIATGLQGADDPIWLPNIGLVFSEPNADRIVRLSDDETLITFVGGLHRPLGMPFDDQGRLISIQSEPGFVGIRVVWPPGKDAVIAERFEGYRSADRMESQSIAKAVCTSLTPG